MKNIAAFILALIVLICFSGCSAETAPEIPEEEKTILQKIEEAETLEDIENSYGGDSRDYYDLPYAETRAISEKVIEILFSDGKLNGIYHYNEYYTPGTKIYEDIGSSQSDTIAICVVSPEEIYIAPYSFLTGAGKGNDVNSLPQLKGCEKYKYKAVSATPYVIDLQYVKDNSELTISYEEDHIAILGNLVHYNDINKLRWGNDYYLDKDKSTSTAQADYEENLAEKEERDKIKNSPPKVGMTESQVKSSKWGYPSKINRNEYSWGVTEQWVFEEGYVYFENGIVTSVQYR